MEITAKPIPKNNKSDTVGVSWNNQNNKWKVQIGHKGKQLYLGYYKDNAQAVKVRKQAELLYNYHNKHGT